MEIFDAVVLFVIGLIMIIKGGDWFVDGAIWIAKKTGIPSLIIGATVVSIGTTIPEICVSTIAIIKGLNNAALQTEFNSMAVGNAVGSMMCNVALILAIVLCIRPPEAEKHGFRSKAIYLVVVTALLVVFSLTESAIVLWEGIVLLVLFAGFIAMNIIEALQMAKKGVINAEEEKEEEVEEQKPYKMILMLIGGAACIGLGANYLVDKGQFLAEAMGIPTQIVAITFVAIGTSLPELVTSITALKKKDANIGLGNIIGANVINGTLLLGLASVISGKGLPIDYVTRTVAVAVLMAITLVLVIPPFIKQKTYRWQGIAMLCLYFGFMAYNIYYVVSTL